MALLNIAAVVVTVVIAVVATAIAVPADVHGHGHAHAHGHAHEGSPAAALIDVFEANTYGYSCFRVPSAVLNGATGSLFVFVESRISSCGDQAPKDITFRKSPDGGNTFGPLNVVMGQHTSNTTYRNPYAVWVDDGSPKGLLLLNFVNSTLAEPWTNYQISSHDDGITWSAPVAKNLAPWEGVLAGPGAGIVLGRRSATSPHPGRIVMCGATGYHHDHAMNAVVWYSDDKGSTYDVSSSVFAQFQECQMTERNDGSLIINFRAGHMNACDCRASSVSHDGGETWSNITWDTQLVEPVCSAGLITRPNGNLLFSNPMSKTQRANMTVQQSVDNGATWQVVQTVWPGPSAYSTLVDLSNATSDADRVGLVFERGTTGPYSKVTLAQLQV
eukprot:m.22478 g.22478  ORF g.22478 m.22478 type:complete len:387 (-) comp6832_c0_seq1:146-1306(-)